MRTNRRSPFLLGIALGTVMGLALGILLTGGGRRGERPAGSAQRPQSTAVPAVRNIYSPTILDDPYVLQELEKSVRIFEDQCRTQRRFCIEAGKTRARLEAMR